MPHTGHDHTHGEGCGHVAVPHGEHVDYLHDGHRHACTRTTTTTTESVDVHRAPRRERIRPGRDLAEALP